MYVATVQLILNLIHACGYTRASTRFTRVKVYNMACIFFVARGFVVRTCAIKHSWHTRHAPHEQTRHERTFHHQIHVAHQTCTTRISSPRAHGFGTTAGTRECIIIAASSLYDRYYGCNNQLNWLLTTL